MIKNAVNIKDFGALGDGIADDSQALLNAINAIDKGAVFIPAGRYKITKIIEVKKGNIVIRGEGQNKTTLIFLNPSMILSQLVIDDLWSKDV